MHSVMQHRPHLLVMMAILILLSISPAYAATSIPFTITTSEAVNVTGTPRIALDVGGVTRYATYTSGTGTSSLTFTYTMVAGDVDLDGVTLTSPMQLNSGTIKDLNGNDATLTFIVPNTSNVKVNYPSLGMDFVADADGRYTLNGTVYNDLTSFLGATGGSFARASTATYYDSTGTIQTAASGAPRFDYDPATHDAKGILIEESRTNLLTRSSEFENGVWGPAFITVTPNTTSSPDGASTADKWVEDTSNNIRYTQNSSFSPTGPTAYTVSVYVKSAGRSNFAIELLGFHGSYVGSAGYDLIGNSSTFNPRVVATSNVSRSIQSVGNGWYRCTLTATMDAPAAPSSTPRINFLFSDSSSYTSYFGDGTSGVYVWGAQLEAGSFPTSYIPTTATTVTRQADNLTIPTGGWFDSTKGTGFSEFDNEWNLSSGTTRIALALGVLGRFIYSLAGDATIYAYDGTNGLGYGTMVSGTSINRAASTYSGATLTGSLNGGAVSSALFDGTFGSSPIVVGNSGSGSAFWCGHIRKTKYYPVAVPNTHLQLMTQ